DKKNRLLRLTEMFLSVLHSRNKTCVILIDTYSTANFYYAVAVAALARKLNIPYIPILHGGNLPERLQKSPRLSRELFGQAILNIAPSGYLQEAFDKEGYKVIHIPNALDIEKYPFTLRQKVRPRFLYVRAFSRLYNPLLLIEAFARLCHKYPDAHLCMVGPDRDGTLATAKSRARELGLEGSVEFPGKLSKRAWHELSQDYDIFINPTTVDNTPLSVIEAMALGLPIISTAVGGIPWLIKDGKEGLLVPSSDIEAMTKAMERLIEDPDLAMRLSRNGRRKAESFDWESSVKGRWIELLKEIGCVPL
ncbi:glycosyltransferase family 4 protein, partial [Nitratifractor sp.]